MKMSILAAVVAVAAGVSLGFFVAQSILWHRSLACHEKVSRTEVDRELALLRAQFGDEEKWRAALRASHLWKWQLRRDVEKNLRGRTWLDRQLAPAISVSDDECRADFTQHQTQFAQPVRYRAAHLFLAAPPETPDEILAAKRRTIDDCAQRLKQGEQFVDLVAQFSEDEATKKRGGDLGYFSETRMPEDFMAAVRALPVGQLSEVVQTKLGFHILQVTEVKPARVMSFEEARPEIAAELQNAKRREAVEKLIVDLAGEAEFVRK
jgi:parvulin-like peptidyl-prolyl isomerase